MCAVNLMQVKAKFVEREVEIAAHVYTNDAKQGGLIIDILRLEVGALAVCAANLLTSTRIVVTALQQCDLNKWQAYAERPAYSACLQSCSTPVNLMHK
jgi:predicted RNA-binding protein